MFLLTLHSFAHAVAGGLMYVGLSPAGGGTNQSGGGGGVRGMTPSGAPLPGGAPSLQFHPAQPAAPARGRGGTGGRGRGGVKSAQNPDAAKSPDDANAADADAKGSKNGNAPISHGASEKQRRDRINAMIDELRTLVPPSATARGADIDGPSTSDTRRSKCSVLQDTINMLKRLDERIMEQELELSYLRRGIAYPGFAAAGEMQRQQQQQIIGNGAQAHTGMIGAPGNGVGAAMAMPGTAGMQQVPIGYGGGGGGVGGGHGGMVGRFPGEPMQVTPQVPVRCGPQMKITVDVGEHFCHIQVQSPDRRGLLQDILKALYQLPMRVNRSVVNTDTDEFGVIWVTDIFELVYIEGVPRITGDEVRARLHRSLTESIMEYEYPDFFNKKRKEVGEDSGPDSVNNSCGLGDTSYED